MMIPRMRVYIRNQLRRGTALRQSISFGCLEYFLCFPMTPRCLESGLEIHSSRQELSPGTCEEDSKLSLAHQKQQRLRNDKPGEITGAQDHYRPISASPACPGQLAGWASNMSQVSTRESHGGGLGTVRKAELYTLSPVSGIG